MKKEACGVQAAHPTGNEVKEGAGGAQVAHPMGNTGAPSSMPGASIWTTTKFLTISCMSS